MVHICTSVHAFKGIGSVILPIVGLRVLGILLV